MFGETEEIEYQVKISLMVKVSLMVEVSLMVKVMISLLMDSIASMKWKILMKVKKNLYHFQIDNH